MVPEIFTKNTSINISYMYIFVIHCISGSFRAKEKKNYLKMENCRNALKKMFGKIISPPGFEPWTFQMPGLGYTTALLILIYNWFKMLILIIGQMPTIEGADSQNSK